MREEGERETENIRPASTLCQRRQRLMIDEQDRSIRNTERDLPTTMNSAGMKNRRAWKRILRVGQPGDFQRRQVRGERTRVSHAATVSVQTRKYLWALRWGGRLSSLGNWIGGRAAMGIHLPSCRPLYIQPTGAVIYIPINSVAAPLPFTMATSEIPSSSSIPAPRSGPAQSSNLYL